MEAFIFIGGFACIVVSGFWVMDRLDRFLNGTSFHSSEDERESPACKR